MAEKMIKYIRTQPDVWQHILSDRTEITSDCLSLIASRKVRKVAMISSGSSNYAAKTASGLLRKAAPGIQWVTSVPSRLDELGEDYTDTIVFAISQSGKSTSTERAIKDLRKHEAVVVSVTSDASSPIALAGDVHVLIQCGEESIGPKTKGMTATVLTLYLVGLEIAKAAGNQPADPASLLKTAFSTAPLNIQHSFEFAYKNAKLLAEASSLTLVADGTGLPIIEEGALKLLETLYIPASAWEFEEYLHGVNNIIGPGIYHIFLLQDNENFERMNKLIEYCDARGCVVLVVNCSGRDIPYRNTLNLECTGRAETLPYEALLPFQVLSAVVSEEKHIQCDRPRYPDFYAALGTKTDAKKGA